MEKREQETIILINEKDLEEGYISIGTFSTALFASLLKRLGRDSIVSQSVSTDRKGRPVWYDLKVKAACWSRRGWQVRRPPQISPQRREQARERLLRIRAGQAISRKLP